MAASTSIEWAANADGSPGATWNPIRARDRETGLTGTFCVHASEGCRNCYAETLQARKLPGNGIGLPYTAPNLARVEHYLDERMLAAPLKRRKPTTYFLSSMTDVFGEWVPDAMLDKLFAVMALRPDHTFIVVTKRSARMRAYFTTPTTPSRLVRIANERRCVAAQHPCDPRPFTLPLPNVWLLVSAEDQANYDERVEHLRNTPAAVRGVSVEPMLGAIDIGRSVGWQGEQGFDPLATRIDWVICGGESGRNARPMHPDWARALRDQCAAAGVPFFFKQWGEWKEWRHDVDGPHVEMIDTDEKAETTARALAALGHPVGGLTAGGRFYPTLDAWAASDEDDNVRVMERLGKGRAGRTLDGRTHDERPPIGRAG